MGNVVLAYKTVDSKCRTCLKAGPENMTSLYDEIEHKEGEEVKKMYIKDLLEDIAKIEIESVGSPDKYPTIICNNCVQFLRYVLDFRSRCHKSQCFLKEYIARESEFPNLNAKSSKNVTDADNNDVDVHNEVDDDFGDNFDDQEFSDDNASTTADSASVKNTGIYKCPVCYQKFSTPETYQFHMEKHPVENSTCSICNKTFLSTHFLKKHLSSHSDDRPFSCDICGKSYKGKTSLNTHIMSHTGELPFPCEVCGKGYKQKHDLKKHMVIHTKERPYMCNICGKTMGFAGQLSLHIRTHTGEKPYKCSKCNKAFVSSSRLKRHSFCHAGLRPFKCDECDKCFIMIAHLRKHKKIHRNERPFVCHLCGKGYVEASYLRTHMQSHSKQV